MKSSHRHDDSFENAGNFNGIQTIPTEGAANLDYTNFSTNSRMSDRDQQLNSVGSTSSNDGSWEARQSSLGNTRLMSQEGVFQLTKDLRTFSEALTALKAVFLDERSVLDKGLRVLAHERLGELLQVLRMVVDKYSELNSSEILAMAGTLIKRVKEFNYEDDGNDVSPEIFRAINNLAMVFSNSVSECLMGDANISPHLSMAPSQAFDSMDTPKARNIEVVANLSDIPPLLPTEIPCTEASGYPENVDELLHQMDSGLEMAFDRAKILSKYLSDLITYVKKKAHLEMEHSKNLLKLSQTTKSVLSEQSFLPFQSLYCTGLDHDREYASNCLSMHQTSLLQQKFVEPLQAKKNEHDKKRKSIRDSWAREKKRSEEAIMNMKKAKQTYQSKVQEYQKAKDAAIRAEGDQQSQYSTQSQQKQSNSGQSTLGSVLYSAAASGKMDKKKRQEEDSNLRATQAEHGYKAYVNEANKRIRELDKNKAIYLQQLRELMSQCDQTAKTVTIAYFQHHHRLYAPLPIQFQAMCEDAKRYEPGFQYSDYIRNLPAQPQHGRTDFEFEPCTVDGASYLVQPGAKSVVGDEQSTKNARSTKTNKAFSDTESSSSRSLDDISPSASPGDLTRKSQVRRHSTEGSLSSEDILDESGKDGRHVSLPIPSVEMTPDSSPVALRQQFQKQASKMAANVRGAFKVKKTPKSSLFGVDFATATQGEVDGIPLLVKRCIAEIDNRALSVKGIYRVNGVKNRVEKLCAQFDIAPERIDLSQQSPHDVSGVLKYFLRQLPEPLLQFNLYNKFLEIAKDYQQLINTTNEATNQAKDEGLPSPAPPSLNVMNSFITRIRDTVEILPMENRNTLQYIISHLTRIAFHSHENKMTSSNLAIVFGPTLLRPVLLDGNESLQTLIDMPYQSRVVEMLIIHKDYIFGTHSHQAGNIFPLSGFQNVQPSFSADDRAESKQAIDSSDATTSLQTDKNLLVNTKDVSREDEVLLNFDDDVPTSSDDASTSRYGTSDYQQSSTSRHDSREVISNSSGLIGLEFIKQKSNVLEDGFNEFDYNDLYPTQNSLFEASHRDVLFDGSTALNLQTLSLEHDQKKRHSASSNLLVDISPTNPIHASRSVIDNLAPCMEDNEDFAPIVPARSKTRKQRKSLDELESTSRNISSPTSGANRIGSRSLPFNASPTKIATSSKNRKPSITNITNSLEKFQKSGVDAFRQLSRDAKTVKSGEATSGKLGEIKQANQQFVSMNRPSIMAGRTPPHFMANTSNLSISTNKISTPPAKRGIFLNVAESNNGDSEKEVSFC